MNREAIEAQLWDYIDGTCNAPDKERISALIGTDITWSGLYNELALLHRSIAAHTDSEQPSMRFTKNVMDAVGKAHIAPATKKYINSGVIKGIAALFIAIIIVTIGYALASVNWNEKGTESHFKTNFDISSFFNSTFFNVFIMVNIVLALVLLDILLRRKQNKHLHG
jgi:hypothetical protein